MLLLLKGSFIGVNLFEIKHTVLKYLFWPWLKPVLLSWHASVSVDKT
jgi:hypothetical protein